MRKIGLCMFCCVAFLGCKDHTPAGILDKEKMQAVLWDVIRADVFTDQVIKKDSSKNAALEDAKMQELIFNDHQVTREEFYKSYSYYSTHSDLMETMLDSMIAQRENERRTQFITPKPRSVLSKFNSFPK